MPSDITEPVEITTSDLEALSELYSLRLARSYIGMVKRYKGMLFVCYLFCIDKSDRVDCRFTTPAAVTLATVTNPLTVLGRIIDAVSNTARRIEADIDGVHYTVTLFELGSKWHVMIRADHDRGRVRIREVLYYETFKDNDDIKREIEECEKFVRKLRAECEKSGGNTGESNQDKLYT